MSIQVVVGSTRHDRLAEAIAPWIARRLNMSEGFQVEWVDLADWNLPFFDEATPGKDGTALDYRHDIVKEWNANVATADGYILLSPEYNRSYPAVLKNALDSVYLSYAMRNKPVGFVGYSVGGAGGARVVEQLALLVRELEAVALRNSVLIPDAADFLASPESKSHQRVSTKLVWMLQDLEWWVRVLKSARSTQLPPARHRKTLQARPA